MGVGEEGGGGRAVGKEERMREKVMCDYCVVELSWNITNHRTLNWRYNMAVDHSSNSHWFCIKELLVDSLFAADLRYKPIS